VASGVAWQAASSSKAAPVAKGRQETRMFDRILD
jgi:hypothetical protein